MKNILLPTDFSSNSMNAINYALQFFKSEKCNFYILHVNRIVSVYDGASVYTPAASTNINAVCVEESKEVLKERLQTLQEQNKNSLHKFYALHDTNFFIESVRKHVEEKEIDLIVLGTKGASNAANMVIGTNTGDVIRKVACKTLIIPEKAIYTDLSTITFPTDFSLNYSIQTLNPLHELLRKTNANLQILHVTNSEVSLNANQQENKDLLEDFFTELPYTFFYKKSKVIENAIEEFTYKYGTSLLVMVAKNLNYFQQLLFHPKVEKLSFRTKIPLLVLHE